MYVCVRWHVRAKSSVRLIWVDLCMFRLQHAAHHHVTGT